jgi:DUF971 family protein
MPRVAEWRLMNACEAETQPRELDLDRTSRLRITWMDGHESVYPLALLRRSCPCAGCRGDREDQKRNPLHVMQPAANAAEMAIAEKAELVGHYALRIKWKDGHDSGIYDYGLLRRLCPCERCGGGAD